MEEINLHTLLFADKIITEDNGKKGIIGVFNIFNFHRFPAVSPPWFVFVQMDNLKTGKYDFTFNLAHQHTQEVVFSGAGSFETREGQEGMELVFPMPPVRFGRDGNYLLSLVLDGREIGQRILKVTEKKDQG